MKHFCLRKKNPKTVPWFCFSHGWLNSALIHKRRLAHRSFPIFPRTDNLLSPLERWCVYARRTAASLSAWLSEGTQSKKCKKWLLRNRNKRKNQGKAVAQRTDYLLSRWAWITWIQFLVNEVFILMRLGACFQRLGSIQPHGAVNEASNMWCSWVLYFCNTNLNKNINDTILFNDLPRGTGAIDNLPRTPRCHGHQRLRASRQIVDVLNNI